MIRAFQWDLARQVEGRDWLLAQLPRYAAWGYQELYLHLENAVDYPSLPGVARADAYRWADLIRIVEAASAVGIGVVPIINLLGHTQYLIGNLEWNDLNEIRQADGSAARTGQLCPHHARTPEVARRLLQDVRPLCTAGKVHVGLDESFVLGRCPTCSAEVAEVGLATHFARYVHRLHALVDPTGLQMGIWADMLALEPAAIPQLPRGIAVYDWYYYPFRYRPKIELHNFRDYDLAPVLAAQGIDYWACPMSGAFRWESLPIFRDRLGNLRSWWQRAQRTNAQGFLVTNWEANRLAAPLPQIIEAGASALWQQDEPADNHHLLTHGLALTTPARDPAAIARLLLLGDDYAHSGYARWDSLHRWDVVADPHHGPAKMLAEAKFFARHADELGTKVLPSLGATYAWRAYLSTRDAFLQRSAHAAWKLRRLRQRPILTPFATHLAAMQSETNTFQQQLAPARLAATTMWQASRHPETSGPNHALLDADTQRLAAWQSWLHTCQSNASHASTSNPLMGRWQLTFQVHLIEPGLQKITVEQQRSDGTWQPIHARHTIEFRAETARRNSRLKRLFSCPLDTPDGLRIAVNGCGRVALSQIQITDGATTRSAQFPFSGKRLTLGTSAPTQGLPTIDWATRTTAVALRFDLLKQ